MNSWKTWAKGLLAAAIGGAANAVALAVVDPADFNLEEGWIRLVTVAAVSAVVAVAAYLKQSPLPGEQA